MRWLQEGSGEIHSPRAYLSTIVVRLCIDQLRSARAQREVYVGPWLPEPILTSQQDEMADAAVQTESLSFAFLVMLEKLSPLERAVFLLREAFDYDYPEIAEMLGKSEANCRQILHRAHQHLEQQRPRFTASREQQERITAQFWQASVNGDMQGLLKLLTDDVVFTADSGGKAPAGIKAGLRPILGRDKVSRGMLANLRTMSGTWQVHIEEVNGQPAIIGYLDGHLCGVILLDIEGEHIRHIYTVLNPDKLRFILAKKQTSS